MGGFDSTEGLCSIKCLVWVVISGVTGHGMEPWGEAQAGIDMVIDQIFCLG